ncbi:MAG: PAS domain S-box protein, partial [Candidatus Omnitrophica bacterium]|nr:PAS domain S-box protein [Candidatus Omnitrophota bacterium]
MKEPIVHKTGIRRKIALIVLLSSLILMIVGLSLGYFLGFRLLRNSIGQNHMEIAAILSEAVNRIVNEEVSDLETYVSHSQQIQLVEEHNLIYEEMNKEAINDYLRQMDKRWSGQGPDETFIRQYLDSPVSKRLKSITEREGNIAEIFITDRQGGLVASSGKTSDFYQADEDWWNRAFDNGKGKTIIDNVIFDESARLLSLSMAVPIRIETGETVGICKAVLDIHRFLAPLEDFKIGKTGHAVLTDSRGYILFHRGIQALSSRFMSEEKIKALLNKRDGWEIVSGGHIHEEKTFVAVTPVTNAYLLENGMSWLIFVDQDAKEVFFPLDRLIIQLIAVTLIMLVVLLFMSFTFSGIFVKPIKQLHEGTERIGKGDLDYKVDIRTNDEIEQLADSFNQMAEDLKKTTTSVSSLNQEIEAHKKAEKALQESQIRYKTIYNASKDAIMVLIPGGRFASGNQATIDMFGCKNEAEFIIKTPAELSPEYQPDGKPSSVKAKEMMNIAVKKGAHSFEWTHKRLNGEEFFAMVLLTSMNLEGEEFLQATVRDITKRKKAEDAIRQSAAEWQRTFDSITDMVFIQNTDFTIVRANKAFADAIGKKPAEIIGKKCYEILHHRDKPWDSCPFEKTKKDAKAHTEEVDDPEIGIPLLVTSSPVFDEDGKLIGSVHAAKDITEIKKAEKLKDEFVSTVSHELRTPLSITKEGVSLALDEIPGKLNQEQKKILSMSKDNIDRLARIINDLLDISKIESGKTELKKVLVNISSVIREICEGWILESDKKKQSIKLDIPKNPIDVHMDQDKMIEVMNNLISNAIKFTPGKGTIKIGLKDKRSNVEVSVSNTGAGIAKEDIPKVFNKFQQFGRTAGPGAKGTGLGLAIAKELVELHGGQIKVESKLEEGTTFIFTIP